MLYKMSITCSHWLMVEQISSDGNCEDVASCRLLISCFPAAAFPEVAFYGMRINPLETNNKEAENTNTKSVKKLIVRMAIDFHTIGNNMSSQMKQLALF